MNWTQTIQNPWFGFAGTAAGFIGILISIFVYRRSRRYAKPCFYRKSMRWFDGSESPHSDLQLTFRGDQVPRFTITQLLFWNAGNVSIRPTDFARASPLRLELPATTRLFDAKVTALTTPETSVTLGEVVQAPNSANRTIEIKFDYLDEDDGFVLQIVHDGESHNDIHFSGKLPGVVSIVEVEGIFDAETFATRMQRQTKFFHPIALALSMIFMIGLGLAGLWNIFSAAFRHFHWHQLLIAPLAIFIFAPVAFFHEERPPRKLFNALTARRQRA